MAKDSPIIVRSHTQEREWLLRLGEGNIVAGVRQLLREAEGKKEAAGKKGKQAK
ncbi:MAG: hypothetical protein HC875_37075 [Anaerolineales bacterium]|nr:hypothetical protein [Anaerolineales bacterium]